MYRRPPLLGDPPPRPGAKPGSSLLQTAVAAVLALGVLLLIGSNIHALSVSQINEGAPPGAPGAAAITRRRDATLVIYVYNAADAEHARNFAFFLRYGVADDGATYRIVVTRGPGVREFPRLPALPPNAEYLRTEACTGTWGALRAVLDWLPAPGGFQYFMVVDSAVRGPFLPPYVAAQPDPMHWTEAFTAKLTGEVKLVGSTVSCEGAPAGGNAAGEWRANPAVSPHAWATDATGWALLAAQPDVFRCHADAWEARYFGEHGASLAVLRAGWNLDCLLTRYQGVDWAAAPAWQCNQRVRPDFEGHYDGISVTPYETVFVPVSESTAAARWSATEAADRYERWADRLLRPAESRPGVASNAWIANHWTAKAEKLVYMNARGPGCFDFPYYAQENPDAAALGADDLGLWEHFVVLGQFQARRHRFNCSWPTGNSFRVGYVLARGPRCFDYRFYMDQHRDLQRAGMTHPLDLFAHFAEFGQFEKRRIRFTCADTMVGLPRGFDTEPEEGAEDGGGGGDAVREAEEAAELLARAGDASDPVQQAIKGVLVSETAKDFARDVR